MATAYKAPEYGRDIYDVTVGDTSLNIAAHEVVGNLGARLTVIGDTMLLGKIKSLALPFDGWFANKLMDTNATATLSLRLDVTDGTDTVNVVPSTIVEDSGAEKLTRFIGMDFLGLKLSKDNRNFWDILVTVIAGAATAGTVGQLRANFMFDMDRSYGLRSDGT